MDESLNHLIAELPESTEPRNQGYIELPECVKCAMTEQEWLWHPDKNNLLEEFCRPEVPEDG